MQRINAGFQLKQLDDAGKFEGYASIFNNVDLGGDVIEPGAFKEFATNKQGEVVVLLQHNSFSLPIGTARVVQDEKGLKFEGSLILEDPEARRAHVHMKRGSLEGMSIGYDVLPGGAEIMESGVRRLSALKLWEISPVIWGMNPKAGITGVKAIPDTFVSKTDLEKCLKSLGFSHTQAKAIAAGGFGALSTPRKADEAAKELTKLSEAIKNFKIP